MNGLKKGFIKMFFFHFLFFFQLTDFKQKFFFVIFLLKNAEIFVTIRGVCCKYGFVRDEAVESAEFSKSSFQRAGF